METSSSSDLSSFCKVIPVVNFNKCQADGTCTHVCPHNVFKIKEITMDHYRQLSFIGKVKTLFNDNRKSFVVNPQNCTNCGRCAEACPEGALQLQAMNEKKEYG
jgi:4Fe-4S ferredoxin